MIELTSIIVAVYWGGSMMLVKSCCRSLLTEQEISSVIRGARVPLCLFVTLSGVSIAALTWRSETFISTGNVVVALVYPVLRLNVLSLMVLGWYALDRGGLTWWFPLLLVVRGPARATEALHKGMRAFEEWKERKGWSPATSALMSFQVVTLIVIVPLEFLAMAHYILYDEPRTWEEGDRQVEMRYFPEDDPTARESGEPRKTP